MTGDVNKVPPFTPSSRNNLYEFHALSVEEIELLSTAGITPCAVLATSVLNAGLMENGVFVML